MIREATTDDLPVLLEMGHQFVTKTIYQYVMSENPEMLRALFVGLMESESGLLLVADRGNKVTGPDVIGAMGMSVYEHPVSGDRVSSESFWWIDPEARGGRDSVRLLRTTEKWVKEQGARWMHMVAPSRRVGQFYERLGFLPLEMHYTKAV
jgi:GNAT superfamily N-acetyltransferase|tara:strand:- start:4465 stop:4917 length:453 start_codon:yes stop_codon:yes gene_type:complete